jgi:hypothetical protein
MDARLRHPLVSGVVIHGPASFISNLLGYVVCVTFAADIAVDFRVVVAGDARNVLIRCEQHIVSYEKLKQSLIFHTDFYRPPTGHTDATTADRTRNADFVDTVWQYTRATEMDRDPVLGTRISELTVIGFDGISCDADDFGLVLLVCHIVSYEKMKRKFLHVPLAGFPALRYGCGI